MANKLTGRDRTWSRPGFENSIHAPESVWGWIQPGASSLGLGRKRSMQSRGSGFLIAICLLLSFAAWGQSIQPAQIQPVQIQPVQDAPIQNPPTQNAPAQNTPIQPDPP